MGFTPEQIKGRIKSVAKQNNADARTLMRIYMMERFLERLAQSEYRDNFIIKGGILVTAMIGVAHRSTMDIDTSMKNLNLSAEDALRVVNQVKDIDLDDGVSFEVKDVSNIMDEMEYPGIRVTMNANVGRLITPLKIDISTGDVITPRAIEFNYDLLLEDRSISLWSYNLETILAEKLQTVLARGILNTRMRDFYDIRIQIVMEEAEFVESIRQTQQEPYRVRRIERQIRQLTAEKAHTQGIKEKLYGDYAEKILTREDFLNYNELYSKRIEEHDRKITELEAEQRNLQTAPNAYPFLDVYRKYRKLEEITRPMIVELIEKIEVYEGNRVEITFRFHDEIADLLEELHQKQMGQREVSA